jgi:fatty-acyl-CoA synthase
MHTVSNWNYADVWEAVADSQPDSPAITQGSRHISWAEFDHRSDGIARWLQSLSVSRQDKVALYLYNSPEYLEGCFGAMKIGLVPVNTNYRYVEDELTYLWDNADAVAVIFHGTFAERIERIRGRVPGVRGWLWVDDGSGPCPEWATPYEDAAKSADGRVGAEWGRSGDDLLMLYTGGTTGMPKGVMWRQDDLFARTNAPSLRRYDEAAAIDGVRQVVSSGGPGMSLMPACPLMHGTGCFMALECLAEAGRVVLLAGRHLDAEELLDTIAREKVNGLVMVGDPFGRPILAALDAEPGRWDLSSLVAIISSGAMWSEEIKQGLLRHHPNMLLMDVFSSSEAIGMGSSLSSGASAAHTAEFVLGPEVKVFTPDDREVAPGSEEVGVLALGGRNPLGYYKDETKTASTFKVIGGVRYSIPGDFATVRPDGTIHLLGRGSVCINTAGEKVFPEEVEEALKKHPTVHDAVVVGIPHPVYGEEVVAVVEPATGAGAAADPDPDELIAHVKEHLAHYKAPRRIRVVETIGRAPNGKVDYGRHKQETADWDAATA